MNWRRERGLDKLRPSSVRYFPTLQRAVRTLENELFADNRARTR